LAPGIKEPLHAAVHHDLKEIFQFCPVAYFPFEYVNSVDGHVYNEWDVFFYYPNSCYVLMFCLGEGERSWSRMDLWPICLLCEERTGNKWTQHWAEKSKWAFFSVLLS